MLGMGKPVHIFQLEQVWKKWLIWLPLLLLMLKKTKEKNNMNRKFFVNAKSFFLIIKKYRQIQINI
jgi:hypothetical protein